MVHPPFRWQRDYARDFNQGLARMAAETDVIFAVENMYPLRAGGAELAPTRRTGTRCDGRPAGDPRPVAHRRVGF